MSCTLILPSIAIAATHSKILQLLLYKEIKCPIAATASHPKRVDYEYERAETASIFMFTEPLAG